MAATSDPQRPNEPPAADVPRGGHGRRLAEVVIDAALIARENLCVRSAVDGAQTVTRRITSTRERTLTVTIIDIIFVVSYTHWREWYAAETTVCTNRRLYILLYLSRYSIKYDICTRAASDIYRRRCDAIRSTSACDVTTSARVLHSKNASATQRRRLFVWPAPAYTYIAAAAPGGGRRSSATRVVPRGVGIANSSIRPPL